jgi:hydroxypyruvate isomerase
VKTNRRAFLGASAAAAASAGLTAVPAPAQQPAATEDVSALGRTPHTRFAPNLEMWWTRLPFIRRMEEAARLGYRAVEFWPWRGKDIPAIAAACQRLNLEVSQFSAWGFRPGLNDPANHNHFVDEIRASLETARRLNVRLMCVVGGDDIAGMSQQQMHQNIITGLNRVKRMVEDAGVTLILEPMNIRVDHRGHCLYGFEPAKRIIDAVNSRNVKILWDLYHMQITEGDICGHLREGFRGNYIAYLQVADTPGRNEPGTGEVHYNRVLKEVHDNGYRGYIGLECRPRSDEVTAARAALRADQW